MLDRNNLKNCLKNFSYIFRALLYAGVAEQADARDLKSLDGNIIRVRFPSPAPFKHNKGVIIISRSYKKTPYCGDKKSKDLKRYANRIIRQRLKNSDDKLNYKSYRKAYESWNICDFYTIAPDFETYYKFMVDQWHSRQSNGWHEPYPTREQARKEYRKYYKNK